MFSKVFATACLASAALSIDLNSANRLDIDLRGNSDIDIDTDVDLDVDVDAETEWLDANICITYGEDNSNGGGSRCGSCGSCSSVDCSGATTTVSCDEVTYQSATFDIQGISGISAGGTNASTTVTVAGTTSYEILGYGAGATVRNTLTLTLSSDGAYASGDETQVFMLFVDDDNILNGYTGRYEDDDDTFRW